MQKLPRLLEISPGQPLMHGRRWARAACQHLRDGVKAAKKFPTDWLGRYANLVIFLLPTPLFWGGKRWLSGVV